MKKDHVVYIELAPGDLCGSRAETEEDARKIAQSYLDQDKRVEIFTLAKMPGLHRWKPKKLRGAKS